MSIFQLPENCQVVRSRRRTRIAVVLCPDGTMELRTPWHCPAGDLERAWQNVQPWLARKRRELAQAPEAQVQQFCFQIGSKFYLQGKLLPLERRTEPYRLSRISYDGTRLLTGSDDPEIIQRMMARFYRKEMQKISAAKLEQYCLKFGISVRKVSISNARCRFGSCNAAGDLHLSWRLAMFEIRSCSHNIVVPISAVMGTFP